MKSNDRAMDKVRTCQLRKTEPKGALTMCKEDCFAFDPCVEYSRLEREEKKNPKKKEKPKKKNKNAKSRICKLCGKSIAKPQTPNHSFKGMMMIHLKHKHPRTHQNLIDGEISFDETWQLGRRKNWG